MRHTILSAIIAARNGTRIAKEATDAHENDSNLPSSSQNGSTTFQTADVADQEADLRNNEIGRTIGAPLTNATNKEIATKVLNHFKDNGLNVLRTNPDGTTTVITTRIGATQVTNTLTNWANRNANTGFTPAGEAEVEEIRKKQLEKNLTKTGRGAE